MSENCIYDMFIEINNVMIISHCFELRPAPARSDRSRPLGDPPAPRTPTIGHVLLTFLSLFQFLNFCPILAYILCMYPKYPKWGCKWGTILGFTHMMI